MLYVDVRGVVGGMWHCMWVVGCGEWYVALYVGVCVVWLVVFGVWWVVCTLCGWVVVVGDVTWCCMQMCVVWCVGGICCFGGVWRIGVTKSVYTLIYTVSI